MVKLQPYDPMVSGRGDLLAQFVLPKHALVAQATSILLASWQQAPEIELGAMRTGLLAVAKQCLAVQSWFIKHATAAAAGATPDDAALARALMADTADAEDEESADSNVGILKAALLRAVTQTETANLHPLPSVAIVALSVLEALRAMRAVRPHIAGIADYLQYSMLVGIDLKSLDAGYKVATVVDHHPAAGAAVAAAAAAAAVTAPLPPLVAELVDKHCEHWNQHLSPVLRLATDETSGLPVRQRASCLLLFRYHVALPCCTTVFHYHVAPPCCTTMVRSLPAAFPCSPAVCPVLTPLVASAGLFVCSRWSWSSRSSTRCSGCSSAARPSRCTTTSAAARAPPGAGRSAAR
eukprot:SAG22_NODE_383_length_11344_cov_6.163895_7_plen_352_part_00